jgi:hypothetical protein
MDKPFLSLLSDHLAKVAKEKDEYYKNRPYAHYPSSASSITPDGNVVGACLRNQYWKAIKEPSEEQWNLASQLQRGFGDAIHNWLFEKLKKIDGFVLTAEHGGKLTVEGLTREISYRMDGHVSIGDKFGGVELKTSQGRAIDKMIKEGGPKEHHILQVMDYYKANPNFSFFSMIYVARDSGFSVEFMTYREKDAETITVQQVYPFVGPKKEMSHLTMSSMLARRKALEAAVGTMTLPPRDYKVFLNKDGEIQDIRTKKGEKYKSDFWCLYCDFAKKCWSMPDALANEKEIK